MIADDAWPRPFRVTWPDGYRLHGVQFPTGRCVLDDETSGFVQGATSFENLTLINDLAVVEWADGEHAGNGPSVAAAGRNPTPESPGKHDERSQP